MNITEDVFKMYKKITGKDRSILLVIFLFVVSLLAIGLIYQYSTEKAFDAIVFRLCVFFFGSILTMSMFTYTKIFTMSSVQVVNSTNVKSMAIGIISILIAVLTVEVPHKKLNDIIPCNSIVDGLVLIHIIALSISLTLFFLILMKFTLSFNINYMVDKNLYLIRKYCIPKIESYPHTKSKRILRNLKSIKLNEVDKISDSLEIYYQNLFYILSLKNTALINKHLSQWGNISSILQNRLLYSDRLEEVHRKLFIKTLLLNSKLIMEIYNDISLEEEKNTLINNLFNSLPIFEESLSKEQVGKENYNKLKDNYVNNYNKLQKSYYSEVYKVIDYIYKKDENILSTISNSLPQSSIDQSSFMILKGRINLDLSKNYTEEIFLGLLFTTIIENKNSNLPTIMYLLFSVQNSKLNNQIANQIEKTTSSGILLDLAESIDELKPNDSGNIVSDIIFNNKRDLPEKSLGVFPLSTDTTRKILIAIIKANEIENYKAVGYLIKRLCNHINNVEEFLSEILSYRDGIFYNSKIEMVFKDIYLNRYSLEYCFNKSILLIAFHLYNSKDERDKIDLSKLNEKINIEFRRNIYNAVYERHKEYNLSCLMKDYIEKYKEIFMIEENQIKNSSNKNSVFKYVKNLVIRNKNIL